MNAAGKKGNGIANKYRSKGLRVVAIDITDYSQTKSIEKWKAAGADFYLYNMDMNCLEEFYKRPPGYPYNLAIKEWKKVEIGDTETSIKNAFGF